MPRKLRLVKGAAERAALVYGMRVFAQSDVAGVEDAQVRLNDGSTGRVSMHLIEGTRAQIRRLLGGVGEGIPRACVGLCFGHRLSFINFLDRSEVVGLQAALHLAELVACVVACIHRKSRKHFSDCARTAPP